MKTIQILILLILISFINPVYCQVLFSSRPSSLQLYPRQVNDSSSVVISGRVNTTGYTKAIFTMRKNGTTIDSSIVNLSYSAGLANFSKTYKIHAEKSSFLFAMYLYNGNALRVLCADSVCSGDVFLVNGQSNAVALATTTVSDTSSIWVRSFGTRSQNSAECLSDTLWGIANAGTGSLHCGIGVWAYRLGKLISDSTGLPVCFINGGKIGSRITEHLPLANHDNTNSIYGRLLFRCSKAKVNSSIKTIFWYQGESDTDTAHLQYANRFNQLYHYWKQDYTGFSKIVVIQTRPGCMSGNNFLYHSKLREIIRTLPTIYNDVDILTTNAIAGYDGCHFTVSGYNLLAEQLYHPLMVSLYNRPSLTAINPPKILKAIYTNNSNTEISLIFDQPVIWPSNFNGYSLKDYIYLNSTTTITNGYAVGDTIKLQLSASTNADQISYLPGIYYTGTQNTYQGPWLVNSRNVGVPSFYQFKITNSLNINGPSCTSVFPTLSTNRTGQNYQWYLNGNIINGAINKNYLVMANGIYKLVMKDNNNLTVTSNLISISNGHRIPVITSLNGQFNYCDGGNVIIQCDVTANTFQWYKNGIVISNANGANYSANANGNYTVTAQHSSVCSATSLPVTITKAANHSASISTNNQFDFCKDSLVTLTANNGVGFSYQWQKNNVDVQGANQNIFNTNNMGSYRVIVSNIIGCTKASSNKVIPVVNPIASISASSSDICPNDTVILTANSGVGYVYQWFKNNALMVGYNQPFYLATAASSYGVRVTNNMGCSTSSPAKIIVSKPTCDQNKTAYMNIEKYTEALVYPNPFTNEIVVRFFEEIPTNRICFEIFNIRMEKIMEYKNTHLNSNKELHFNVENLVSGMYFYRLTDVNNCSMGKIIKH